MPNFEKFPTYSAKRPETAESPKSPEEIREIKKRLHMMRYDTTAAAGMFSSISRFFGREYGLDSPVKETEKTLSEFEEIEKMGEAEEDKEGKERKEQRVETLMYGLADGFKALDGVTELEKYREYMSPGKKKMLEWAKQKEQVFEEARKKIEVERPAEYDAYMKNIIDELTEGKDPAISSPEGYDYRVRWPQKDAMKYLGREQDMLELDKRVKELLPRLRIVTWKHVSGFVELPDWTRTVDEKENALRNMTDIVDVFKRRKGEKVEEEQRVE